MRREKSFSITYRFLFESGEEKVFDLKIDSITLTLLNDFGEEPPEWTRVEHIRCEACTTGETYCRLAKTIGSFIKQFDKIPSFEKVKVSVETEQRTYYKETSLQAGVGGIFGILMTTSGCPVLGRLKPMVRYHLPFADIEETEYRVFSMYMLAQYFRMKKGLKPDMEMVELRATYEEIIRINQRIANAIADLEKMDASINAVVALNNFADSVTFTLDEKLEDIERLFENWMV